MGQLWGASQQGRKAKRFTTASTPCGDIATPDLVRAPYWEVRTCCSLAGSRTVPKSTAHSKGIMRAPLTNAIR